MTDILAFIDDGRWEDARNGAIDAWHACADPRLGDLCWSIATLHLAPDADAKKAWKAENQNPGSVELDVLITTVLPVRRSGTLADRARLLSHRAPDPRVGAALEHVLREMPFTSNSARGSLGEVFDIVARVAEQDPRFARIAETLDEAWNVREDQRKWLFRRFSRVAEGIDARWPTVPRIADEALTAALERLEPEEPETGIDDDLEARMFAAPWDEGPRAVLRDALLEAGDPRGELMALQARGDDSDGQDALIAEHAEAWLGPIAPFVTVTEWRDGYPWAGSVRFGQPRDVDAHGTHAAWRTLGEVHLYGSKVGPMLHPFLETVCDTVRVLRSTGEAATLLTAHDWPRLERLDVGFANTTAGRALSAHPLPALRHLRVRTNDVTWIRDAVWLPQLQTIELDAVLLRGLAELFPALVDSTQLQWARTALGALEQGLDGRPTRLRLAHRPLGPQERPTQLRRNLLTTSLPRFPDAALTEIIVELDHPSLWTASVEALIVRSTRLQRASLPDGERTFDRPLVDVPESLDMPLPALLNPMTVGAGPAGVYVAQSPHVLRIDPSDGTVLEALETGRVNQLVVTEQGPVCAVPGALVRPGVWRNEGHAGSLSVGTPGILATGAGQIRVVDIDGHTTFRITSGTKNVSQAVFSPDGSRVAAVGFTKLRLYETSGGRAKMPHPAPQTRCVAWTEAGIWMAPHRANLMLLRDDGTVLRTVDVNPTTLKRWSRGVLAIDGREVAVLDDSGDELLRVSGRMGWPLAGGLLVRNHQEAETWFRVVPWPCQRIGSASSRENRCTADFDE